MLNWLKRHKLLMIIFSIVLVLCIIISISYVKEGAGKVGTTTQSAVTFVQKPVTNVVDGIKDGVRGIFRFRAIVKENEALKEEIQDMEREIIALKLKENELEELRQLTDVLNYQAVGETLNPVTANVVSMDGSNYFNIFVIDRGNESGVEKDCIVVNGAGLVGRVMESGKGTAKVISLIDEDSKVSFVTTRDMSIMGIVEGDGKGGLVGYTLDAEAEIIKGDVLLTSGLGIFSGGIEIGTVTSVTYNQDTQLKTITVEPKVSFKSIKKVTVLI